MAENLHTKGKPPTELTNAEVQRLFITTGKMKGGGRDHVIYSVALGAGLREHEIAALRWEQVLTFDGQGRTIRQVVEIATFKNSRRKGGVQVVRFPDDTRRKLWNFWNKCERPTEGPVFVSQKGGPLSTRTMREGFAKWQKLAGFDRRYTFHHLRHTFCRRLLDSSGDLTIVRRAARHSRITTTAIYTEPGDERLTAACRKLSA